MACRWPHRLLTGARQHLAPVAFLEGTLTGTGALEIQVGEAKVDELLGEGHVMLEPDREAHLLVAVRQDDYCLETRGRHHSPERRQESGSLGEERAS